MRKCDMVFKNINPDLNETKNKNVKKLFLKK